MTPAQTALYFREWNAVRQLYVAAGIDPKLAEAKRHELHKKALGQMKSSKDFTNADFDKVLAAFRAISRPGDLTSQLRAMDQPELRMLDARNACLAVLADLGIGKGNDIDKAEFLRKAYLDGIVKRITGSAHVDFQTLTDRQANHILHTLRMRRMAQVNAKARKAVKAVDESVPF